MDWINDIRDAVARALEARGLECPAATLTGG